jgi:hypothetical protein
MSDSNSPSVVGSNGATSNSLWSLAFNNTSIFASVDELFWAVLSKNPPSREALSVNVSLALLTSASYALIFNSLPAITNSSLLVFVINAAKWNTASTAAFSIWNSRVSKWAVTAALSVTYWNKESKFISLSWAVASSALVSHLHPSSSWEVSLALPLTEVKSDTFASDSA